MVASASGEGGGRDVEKVLHAGDNKQEWNRVQYSFFAPFWEKWDHLCQLIPLNAWWRLRLFFSSDNCIFGCRRCRWFDRAFLQQLIKRTKNA